MNPRASRSAHHLQRARGLDGRVAWHDNDHLAAAALQRAGVRFCIGRIDVYWHTVRAGGTCGMIAKDPVRECTGSTGSVSGGEGECRVATADENEDRGSHHGALKGQVQMRDRPSKEALDSLYPAGVIATAACPSAATQTGLSATSVSPPRASSLPSHPARRAATSAS